VRVRDDGKGIGPELLHAGGRAGHFGLRGMSERATLVGGRLAVWSRLGTGTEVELCVPGRCAYFAHWQTPASSQLDDDLPLGSPRFNVSQSVSR
jgi:signal transduction histidine kinase